MEDQNKILPFLYHLHAGLLFSCLAYRTHPRCSIKHFARYSEPSQLCIILPFLTDRLQKNSSQKTFNLAQSRLLHLLSFSCLCLKQQVSQVLVKLNGKVKCNNLTQQKGSPIKEIYIFTLHLSRQAVIPIFQMQPEQRAKGLC